MGIFGTSSPFDQYVERATSERNTSEDWGQIMDICDRVKDSATGPKDCLKSIARRLQSENPRIVLQAITLLDACINNCGRKFLLEVASREFEQEMRKHLTSARTHHKVSERLRESLKKWAEGDFKGDPQLGLIPALYAKLKQEGYDFNIQSDSPKKTTPKYSNDPNVVNNKQEEDDIARAIQLSLQESGGAGGSAGSSTSAPRSTSSLYSSAAAALTSDAVVPSNSSGSSPSKEPQKARALYDFEAAEDNELTFKAGEIVIVQDSSDPNWWKGTNHRGEGLFPANFVTLDLISESEQPKGDGGKRVSFSECVEVTEVEGAGSEASIDPVEITGEVDEEKIDRLLHVLHEADPTGERPDPPELNLLEEQVNAMAPTIDTDLEQIDRKHAQLARISTDLVDALGLYHQLMREMPPQMGGYFPMAKNPMGIPGQMPVYSQSPTPGMPPPQMYGGSGGGQFMPHMGPPPPGVNMGGPGPYPNMPPSSLPPGGAAPPQPQMPPMTIPNQSLPGQPVHPAQPPINQQAPPPPEFQQGAPNSHDAGAGLMPSYGYLPPNSQYGPPAPPPQAIPQPNGPPPPVEGAANGLTNSFPAYSQPQTVQQPLL